MNDTYEDLHVIVGQREIKDVRVFENAFWLGGLWNGYETFLHAPTYHHLSHCLPVSFKTNFTKYTFIVITKLKFNYKAKFFLNYNKLAKSYLRAIRMMSGSSIFRAFAIGE